MTFELRLPDIGEGLTEAEIIEWLAGVGSEVAANQPIVSVETAKAVVEISAPRAGVLLHQGAPEGAVMEVGELLAVIGEPGETWAGADSPAAEEVSPAAPEPTDVPAAAPGKVRAVPLVRKLAKTLGVDLGAVTGSGPNGQITRADVEAVAATAGDASDPRAHPAAASAGDGEPVDLSATRRAIARNMTRSWTEIPHVTVWGPADGTNLLAARNEGGAPIEAYVIEALVPVLAEFPDFNARFDGTDLVRSATVEMGIAIDTPAGLVVSVVKNAGALSRAGLAAEIDRLAAAAMDRTLTPEEVSGNTFTISNVGAVGGGYGTPIIPHGTTAILSIGRADDDVVVRDKAIAIAPVIPVSLSFDHRIIDGASASRFLNRIIERLERFGAR